MVQDDNSDSEEVDEYTRLAQQDYARNNKHEVFQGNQDEGKDNSNQSKGIFDRRNSKSDSGHSAIEAGFLGIVTFFVVGFVLFFFGGLFVSTSSSDGPWGSLNGFGWLVSLGISIWVFYWYANK